MPASPTTLPRAIAAYAARTCKARKFPAPEHTYAVKDDAKTAKVKTKSKTSA